VSRSNGLVRKHIRRLTNLDDANLSLCAVNGGFKFPSKGEPPQILHQSAA
jgi:hypothetical protein